MFLPLIQEQLFLKYLENSETIQLRNVIDAYISSYFGSWLDYQNLSGDKKLTTAYAPGIATQLESMEVFFEIFPEGRIISLVRNPEDWLACACAHEPAIYDNTRSAVNRWKKSVRTVLEINRKFSGRVCLIRFEDMINRTDAVMRYLSYFLEIKFEDILLIPTFNSIPLQPSEGRLPSITDVAPDYDLDFKALDKDHRTMARERTQDDYQTVLWDVVDL